MDVKLAYIFSVVKTIGDIWGQKSTCSKGTTGDIQKLLETIEVVGGTAESVLMTKGNDCWRQRLLGDIGGERSIVEELLETGRGCWRQMEHIGRLVGRESN